jgi:predicted O-methyltransferase YrrM
VNRRGIRAVVLLFAASAVLAVGFLYRRELLYGPLVRRLDAHEEKFLDSREREAAHNLSLARARVAAEETARYIDENMATVPSYPDRYALFRDSLAAAQTDGLYCEFGVAGGTSINFIADLLPGKTIHGFDSFEGNPEVWNGVGKGIFAQDQLPTVRKNVVLHKGWFDKTVPVFHAEYGQPIAFVHMDADLYSSTATVLEGMADRIVPGTIIQFDEFFNYPGWKKGESKAFSELVEKHGLTFSFIGYSDQQVAVKITGSARK